MSELVDSIVYSAVEKAANTDLDDDYSDSFLSIFAENNEDINVYNIKGLKDEELRDNNNLSKRVPSKSTNKESKANFMEKDTNNAYFMEKDTNNAFDTKFNIVEDLEKTLKQMVYKISETLFIPPFIFSSIVKTVNPWIITILLFIILSIISPYYMFLIFIHFWNIGFWGVKIYLKREHKKERSVFKIKKKFRKVRKRAYRHLKKKGKLLFQEERKMKINVDYLYSTISTFKSIMIPVYLNDKRFNSELDSGSGRTIISRNLIEEAFPDGFDLNKDTQLRLLDVQNNFIPILGTKTLKFYIPEYGYLSINTVILDNNESTFLTGRDFMLRTGLQLKFQMPGGYQIDFRKANKIPHLELERDLILNDYEVKKVTFKLKHTNPLHKYIIKHPASNIPLKVKKTQIMGGGKLELEIENLSNKILNIGQNNLNLHLIQCEEKPFKGKKLQKNIPMGDLKVKNGYSNEKLTLNDDVINDFLYEDKHSQNDLHYNENNSLENLFSKFKSLPCFENKSDAGNVDESNCEENSPCSNCLKLRVAMDKKDFNIFKNKDIEESSCHNKMPPYHRINVDIKSISETDISKLNPEPFNDEDYLSTLSTDGLGISLKDFYDKKDTHIPKIQAPENVKERLTNFIAEHKLAAMHVFDCGKLSDKIEPIEVKLKPGMSVPQNCKSYRSNFHDRMHLDAFFQYLTFHGLARAAPSDQLFGSPVFLVNRSGKNQLPRVVVDLRNVNRVVADNLSVSLPEPFFVLQQLAPKVRYATLLDLKQAFYNLPVSDATLKSGVNNVLAPSGVYQILRCVTGLSSVPASLNSILSKYLHLTIDGKVDFIPLCLNWFDDISIFSLEGESIEDHLQKVFKVLTRLSHLGFKLNIEKSRFCVDLKYESVQILGYELSQGKLCIPEKKLKALREFKKPKTQKELLSYIGSLVYYRNMLSLQIHGHLGVLHKCTKIVNGKWEWSIEADKAFKAIQHELLTSVQKCEALDNPSCQFLLSDASSFGCGAVLISCDLSDYLPKSKISSSPIINESVKKYLNNEQISEISSGTQLFKVLYEAINKLGYNFQTDTFEDFISVIAQHGVPYIDFADYIDYTEKYNTDNYVEGYHLFTSDLVNSNSNLHDPWISSFLLKALASLLRRKLVILRPYNSTLKSFSIGLDQAKPLYLFDNNDSFTVLNVTENVDIGTITLTKTDAYFDIENYEQKDIVTCFFDQLKTNPNFKEKSKIVGFFSKSIPEDLLKKTSAAHCELMSIFLSLMHFEGSLFSKKVFCLTDNSAAVSVLRKSKTAPRNNKLDLLSLKVSLYFSKNVTFMSCSGKQNFADVMSRLLPEQDIHRSQFPSDLSVRFDQKEIIDVPIFVKSIKEKINEQNDNCYMKTMIDESKFDFEIMLRSIEYFFRQLYDSEALFNVLNAIYTQNWLLLGRSLVQLVLSEIIPRIKDQFGFKMLKEKIKLNKVRQDIDKTTFKASMEESSFMAKQFKDVFSKSFFIALQREETKADSLDPTQLIYVKNRILLPKKMYLVFALAYHSQLAHIGADRLYQVLNTYFYIEKKKVLKAIIENITKNCKICLWSKENTHKLVRGSIYNSGIKSVNELISIDLLELSTIQAQVKTNIKAVLVIVDNYSKYVTFLPLKEKTSEEVIYALKIYISIHGSPNHLLSDNAKILKSNKFKQFLADYKIGNYDSSPFKSRARGFVENRVKQCQRLIRYHFATQKEGSLLDVQGVLAMFGYCLNTVPLRNSILNPYNIQFMSLKHLDGDISESQEYLFQKEFFWSEKSVDEKFKSKQSELFKLIRETIDQIKKENLKQLSLENKNRLKSRIRVGDFVLIRDYSQHFFQKNRPLYALDVYQVKQRRKFMVTLKQPFTKVVVHRHITDVKVLDVNSLEKFKIPPSLMGRVHQYTKDDLPLIDYPTGEGKLRRPLSNEKSENYDNEILEDEDNYEDFDDFEVIFDNDSLLPTIQEVPE